MPWHKIAIPPYLCANYQCENRATHEVYNSSNDLIGSFCEKCTDQIVIKNNEREQRIL